MPYASMCNFPTVCYQSKFSERWEYRCQLGGSYVGVGLMAVSSISIIWCLEISCQRGRVSRTVREYTVPSQALSAVGAACCRVLGVVEAVSALTGPMALLELAHHMRTIATLTSSPWKSIMLGFGFLLLFQAVFELITKDLIQLHLCAGASKRKITSTVQLGL